MEETWKAVVGEGSSPPALAPLREETKQLSAVPFRTLQDCTQDHLQSIFSALVRRPVSLLPVQCLREAMDDAFLLRSPDHQPGFGERPGCQVCQGRGCLKSLQGTAAGARHQVPLFTFVTIHTRT